MVKIEMQPLLGILGGLGPLATVDFLDKLTRLTPAKRDQDHLPWLTVSLPGIPDRSHAIQNNNDGPVPFLIQGVSYLASQGVKLIAVPCNTSHFWYEAMQAASSVPILHITDATIEELKLSQSKINVIAILATRATIKTGLYNKRLLANGFKVIELSEAAQTIVDRIILDVKGGEVKVAREEMLQLFQTLSYSGVSTVILGCTELSIVHNDLSGKLITIDSSLSLAKVSLRRLGYIS